jgi:TetR/AcrR family transcriptional regulator, transcriptional repressor for nem operon
MDTRNTTRDDIIRVGLEILGEKGFNSCGIDAVLKTAKIPKGSFYYYFPSKEEFGLAVLDYSPCKLRRMPKVTCRTRV